LAHEPGRWWTTGRVNGAAGPTPIIPDYTGANVRGIVPALLGPTTWANGLPAWMPSMVGEARQVVLLVLDGLGWDQLVAHPHELATLTAMDARPITTVAPTTTATALASIATGLTPAEHGLVGYRMVLAGEVINVLRWMSADRDRRRSDPPADVQPYPAFLGHDVPIVTPAELHDTGFTKAHLGGARPVGWRAASSIAVEVGRLLADGERFVYAYYGGIDKIAHERGFGPFYAAELRTADRLVADVLEVLPPGAVLLVTADHGQVEVGSRIVVPEPEVLDHVSMQSGEGRFRWLHARHGALRSLVDAATDAHRDLAWVVTAEQMVDEHWFGATVPPPVMSRLGDVALVAHAPVSFHDPDDSGPFELVCRHGSLTSAEVLVPLLAAAGS
jgi:Type I phosphodiesterase / nucleotide pyrophosphatase